MCPPRVSNVDLSVIACCFGRIVPSDAAKESWFAVRENPKMKLQGSPSSDRNIPQSQISLNGKTDSRSMG
jgi:hypothetical protein